MSEGKVRHCCHKFKNGGINVHDKESDRPSVQTDELVQQVNRKFGAYRRVIFSALADEFVLVERKTIINTVTEKLGRHKLCAGWLPKIVRDQQKEQRM